MSTAVVDVALDFSKTSPLRRLENKSRTPSPVPSVSSDTPSRPESVSSDNHETEHSQKDNKPQNGPSNINNTRHGSLSSESSSSSTEQNNETQATQSRPFKMYPMGDPMSPWLSGMSPSSSDILSAYSASANSLPFSAMTGAMNPLYETGLSALTLPLSAMLSRKRPRYQDPEANAKKSKQPLVLEDTKDGSYWERRRKNNDAAKRSRDSRRQKEEEIAMRAAFLEQENLKLRAQVAILKSETAKLHYMLYSRSCS